MNKRYELKFTKNELFILINLDIIEINIKFIINVFKKRKNQYFR